VLKIIEIYIKIMKTIAIYPGTFNNFHVGHYNILTKAEKIFDEVIIAVGNNPSKTKDGIFTIVNGSVEVVKDKEPFEVIGDFLSNRTVEGYSGYLTDYLKEKISENPDTNFVIIRGLRNGHDLDYEVNQLRVMEDMMYDGLNVVFIPCDREFEHVSSTMCRQMESIRKNTSLSYYPTIR